MKATKKPIPPQKNSTVVNIAIPDSPCLRRATPSPQFPVSAARLSPVPRHPSGSLAARTRTMTCHLVDSDKVGQAPMIAWRSGGTEVPSGSTAAPCAAQSEELSFSRAFCTIPIVSKSDHPSFKSFQPRLFHIELSPEVNELVTTPQMPARLHQPEQCLRPGVIPPW